MRCFRALHLLLLILCITTAVIAQSTNATVSGLVLDPAGRVIPNANIEILNESTGVLYSGKTNETGIYTVSILPPGQYRLQVSKIGFKSLIKPGIVLNVQSAVALNFTLPLGAASETVTVDTGASQINTTDGSVSTVVDHKFVENIPLNGRSFQDLILLTPGVNTSSPQSSSSLGGTGEFSVNGQRTESNVYTVDGVNANTGGYELGYGTAGTSGSLPAASALGTTQSLVSVDALQEFRVESSSYSAEYGSSPGGQFVFVTRSGSNEAHGTAFDYLRNNYFDANDWFNDNLGVPITALRQNDFGGTLGSRVWIPKLYNGKNKSFFFFSYEGLRLTQPEAAQTDYVPSISLRQSAPAALQPVLNAFPVPTGSDLANGLSPFIQADSVPSSLDSTGVRFDQQITPAIRLFYRFSDTQSAVQTRQLSTLTSTTQRSYTNTAGITAALSERIANDFRLNYTSSTGGTSSVLDSFGGAQPVNLLQLQGVATPTAFASIELDFPGYLPTVSQEIVTQPQHAWNVVDGLTIAHGRQAIKIGLSYRNMASRLQKPSPYIYSYFVNAQAVITNTSYYSSVNEFGRSYPSYSSDGVYIQDEIRVTPRLALSLGVRWEVNPPPTQTSGVLPYIAQGDIGDISSLSLAPAKTRFWKTTYFNLAPRLGVAYQAHNQPGQETVIRAGGGVFFDLGQQNSTLAFGGSPGQSASATYANVSYPLSPAQLAVSITNPPVPPYYETFYFSDRQQLPYTLQWNLSIEQALGKTQAITASYVGSNGRRLLSDQILVPGTRNQNFTFIDNELSGTTSSYNALQLQFQRTLTRGLQVLASYNWAHSIDFGSQNDDFTQIRGNSDYDLRQNVSAAMSYDIPASSSNKLARNLISQWGVDGRFSARSGFPVILNGNEIPNPNGQYGYTGLNLLPGEPRYLRVQGIAGNRRINPAAFSLPVSGENGDAPRNFVRGFGADQIDLAARRSFPLVGTLSLQFRAEVFNLPNHPNFGRIQPTYGNIQFGEAVGTLNQSLGVLSPLYQQGGPRSMQFALKVVF